MYIYIYIYLYMYTFCAAMPRSRPPPRYKDERGQTSQWGQKGDKRSRVTFKSTLAEQSRKSIENGYQKGVRGGGFWKPLGYPNLYKIIKTPSRKICQNRSRENMKNDDKKMPTWSQKSYFFQFVWENVTLGNCQSSPGKKQHFEDWGYQSPWETRKQSNQKTCSKIG